LDVRQDSVEKVVHAELMRDPKLGGAIVLAKIIVAISS
jgi:hypothetical protein